MAQDNHDEYDSHELIADLVAYRELCIDHGIDSMQAVQFHRHHSDSAEFRRYAAKMRENLFERREWVESFDPN